jgi:hypothetical protein
MSVKSVVNIYALLNGKVSYYIFAFEFQKFQLLFFNSFPPFAFYISLKNSLSSKNAT